MEMQYTIDELPEWLRAVTDFLRQRTYSQGQKQIALNRAPLQVLFVFHKAIK